MIVRFNANLETGEAKISPASVRALAELDTLLRADILKDVMYDAINAYNDAVADFRLTLERKSLANDRD